MSILNTTNFNDFSLIDSNRPPDWKKVAKMREEIKRKNLTKEYPLIMNSKAASKRRYGLDGTKIGVVDGQHRFLSCKLEGIKMYYQVSDNVTLDDIPRAAAVQKSWKMTDYIHHHSTEEQKTKSLDPRRNVKPYQYMLLKSYME